MITDNSETALAIRENDIWDESAEVYAELAPIISFYKVTSEKIANMIEFRDGLTIIDLGCGSSGLLSREIFKSNSSINLICVDTSKKMLDVLSKSTHNSTIRYIQSDLADLHQYIEKPADYLLINSAFFWVDTPQICFNQIREILNIGGKFLFNVAEWHLNFGENVENNPKHKVIQEQLRKRNLDVWKVRRPMKKITPDDLYEILQTTGFNISRMEELAIDVTLEDWCNFYSIPAIAKRSLPSVPLEAMSIWKEALEVLRNEQKNGISIIWPPMKWLFICATRMK